MTNNMGCGKRIAEEIPVLVQAEMGAGNGYKKWQGKAVMGLWISHKKGNDSTETKLTIGYKARKFIQMLLL